MSEPETFVVQIHWRVPMHPGEQIFRLQVRASDSTEARKVARAEWSQATPEPRLWLYSTCERESEKLSLF